MALNYSSPEEYLKSGGTLVNGQIPTMTAPEGKPFGTIDSSALTASQSITLPAPANLPNYVAQNSAIPFQSLDQILTATPQNTQAAQQETSLLGDIASITGQNKSLPTLQAEQYQQANLGQLAATKRSLATQLQGLNDQAAQLQLDYQYTIPNQMQEQSVGRGITAAGLQPLTAGELRKNQIAQGALAARALPLKAAYYAASDDYATAKEAADLAAQIAFDVEERTLKAKRAQLEALQPTLDREEQDRAFARKALYDQQQREIEYAREDFTTGQGLAITAMKLNPNDNAAQYAAQQALKIDPHDPGYLRKVMGLVGQYQADPLAIQRAIDDHLLVRAQINKINADIEKTKLGVSDGVVDPKTGQPISQLKLDARSTAEQLLSNFSKGVGASAVGGDFLNRLPEGLQSSLRKGSQSATFVTQFNNLVSLLSLDNIKYLKGQGQVSDAERKLLADASTKLSRDLSDEEFTATLKTIVNALGGNVSSGGTVIGIGPDGREYEVPESQIDAFIRDGGRRK